MVAPLSTKKEKWDAGSNLRPLYQNGESLGTASSLGTIGTFFIVIVVLAIIVIFAIDFVMIIMSVVRFVMIIVSIVRIRSLGGYRSVVSVW